MEKGEIFINKMFPALFDKLCETLLFATPFDRERPLLERLLAKL